MSKKKIEFRYGDIIKFSTPLSFNGQQHYFHGTLAGFTEDTFLVDVLPPARGKKLPTIELRSVKDPKRVCGIKGWKSMDFEVVRRLPEDVQVFKTRYKTYTNLISMRDMVLTEDHQTWDRAALTAYRALDAARALGCALVIFRSMGYVEVHPVPTGVPSLETLQEAVGGYIEAVDASALGGGWDGPYIAYANEEGLMVEDPIFNGTARYALYGDPTLRDLDHPVRGEHNQHLYAGDVVLEVGFSVCSQTGNTIRTPIGAEKVAAA